MFSARLFFLASLVLACYIFAVSYHQLFSEDVSYFQREKVGAHRKLLVEGKKRILSHGMKSEGIPPICFGRSSKTNSLWLDKESWCRSPEKRLIGGPATDFASEWSLDNKTSQIYYKPKTGGQHKLCLTIKDKHFLGLAKCYKDSNIQKFEIYTYRHDNNYFSIGQKTFNSYSCIRKLNPI